MGLTRVLQDQCGRSRLKQLAAAVKMSLFLSSVSLTLGTALERRRSQVSMRSPGRAFQMARSEAVEGGGGGFKLYQVCYDIPGSNRARAAKSLWQQCNLRIQTNGGRSAHIWLHLGGERVAVSRRFVIYFHKELAR